MRRRDLLVLSLLLPLAACDRGGQAQQLSIAPVPIGPDDECAVCGMTIRAQPGPKGQLFLTGQARPVKFCSTVDMFAFALQPEHRGRIAAVYVHDMAGAAWDAPADERFVPAREAWFVAGGQQHGAMGRTLASFHRRADAEAFGAERGGRPLAYDEVSLDVLRALRDGAGHQGKHS